MSRSQRIPENDIPPFCCQQGNARSSHDSLHDIRLCKSGMKDHLYDLPEESLGGRGQSGSSSLQN